MALLDNVNKTLEEGITINFSYEQLAITGAILFVALLAALLIYKFV